MYAGARYSELKSTARHTRESESLAFSGDESDDVFEMSIDDQTFADSGIHMTSCHLTTPLSTHTMYSSGSELRRTGIPS